MSDFIPYPGLSSSAPGAASHVAHDASVVSGALDPAFVGVDATFAERLTTTHAQWFELALEGQEEFTRDIPNRGEEALQHLDERGLPAVGTEVKPGTFLIGYVRPRGDAVLSPEEKLTCSRRTALAARASRRSRSCSPTWGCRWGCDDRMDASLLTSTRAR
jgi:hypothetical protein